jgi:hypothetical protein
MSNVYIETKTQSSAKSWTEQDQAEVIESMFNSMDTLYPSLYESFIPFIATLPPVSMSLADIFQQLSEHIGYKHFDRTRPVKEVFEDMDHFLRTRVQFQH